MPKKTESISRRFQTGFLLTRSFTGLKNYGTKSISLQLFVNNLTKKVIA